MFGKDLARQADTVTGVLEENIRDQKVDLVSLAQGQGFLGVDRVENFVARGAELSFHERQEVSFVVDQKDVHPGCD